jgi:hypothetical protein
MNRRDFLKGIACAAASVILPKAEALPPGIIRSPVAWTPERHRHIEIALRKFGNESERTADKFCSLRGSLDVWRMRNAQPIEIVCQWYEVES